MLWNRLAFACWGRSWGRRRRSSRRGWRWSRRQSSLLLSRRRSRHRSKHRSSRRGSGRPGTCRRSPQSLLCGGTCGGGCGAGRGRRDGADGRAGTRHGAAGGAASVWSNRTGCQRHRRLGQARQRPSCRWGFPVQGGLQGGVRVVVPFVAVIVVRLPVLAARPSPPCLAPRALLRSARKLRAPTEWHEGACARERDPQPTPAAKGTSSIPRIHSSSFNVGNIWKNVGGDSFRTKRMKAAYGTNLSHACRIRWLRTSCPRSFPNSD